MNQIYQAFLNIIKDTTGPVLWVVDEHAVPLNPAQLEEPSRITFLTNRIDQFNALTQQGMTCQYSDFDFDALPDNGFDLLLYRVSKEKAIVHHVINQAAQVLSGSGTLVLAGGKNEGIKTYVDKAAKYLNTEKQLEKISKDDWIAELSNQYQAAPALDDKNYQQLNSIAEVNGLTLISKPGVFGWNKVDLGSAFLLEQMPEFMKRLNLSKDQATQSVIDLGCGYGFLLSSMAAFGFQTLVGTDNNAAAITAAKATLAANELEGEIIAADCAEGIDQKFDVVVCNPPFHQGFSVEGELTDRFLASARRLLTSGGAAIFVVNAFIPIESKAKQYFKKVDELANNKKFKVIRLAGKKPYQAEPSY